MSEIELPGLDCGLCGFRTCDDWPTGWPTSPSCSSAASRCRPTASACRPRRRSRPGGEPAARARSRAPCPSRPRRRPCAVWRVDCARLRDAGRRGWVTTRRRPAIRPPTRRRAAPAASAAASQRSLAMAGPPGPRVRLRARALPRGGRPARADHPPQPDDHARARDPARRVLIGRPLGISCGCPITHCGIVQSVDMKTGTIVWCVTGPLHPRQHGFKDIGYYSAQAYEGLITRRAHRGRDRPPLLVPAAHVHDAVAAQRPRELPQPRRRRAPGPHRRALDRVASPGPDQFARRRTRPAHRPRRHAPLMRRSRCA